MYDILLVIPALPDLQQSATSPNPKQLYSSQCRAEAQNPWCLGANTSDPVDAFDILAVLLRRLQVKGSAAGRCELQGFRGYALEM